VVAKQALTSPADNLPDFAQGTRLGGGVASGGFTFIESTIMLTIMGVIAERLPWGKSPIEAAKMKVSGTFGFVILIIRLDFLWSESDR
jgi:hypothetical protein